MSRFFLNLNQFRKKNEPSIWEPRILNTPQLENGSRTKLKVDILMFIILCKNTCHSFWQPILIEEYLTVLQGFMIHHRIVLI